MSEMKKKAKKEMLSELSKEMKEMQREGYGEGPLADKMKVSVAADSKKGLEEGLSKAQEIMKMKGLGMMDEEESEEMCGECGSEECECEESPESEEMMEDEEESEEDLLKKIEELQAKLASKA